MLNNHVQNPNRNNSQKNFHTFGRAELTTSRSKNGCHPGSKCCKNQLIIPKAIYEDCKRRNKNLSVAWIDYQQALDSVPHSSVEKSIELVGLNSKLLDFVRKKLTVNAGYVNNMKNY